MMDHEAFLEWLIKKGQESSTAASRVSSVRRVEKSVGDLDAMCEDDSIDTLLASFAYSTQDEKDNRPNPTSVPINGDLRTGLASLRQAIALYKEFKSASFATPDTQAHLNWLSKVTPAEVLAAMDDCDAEGVDGFLDRVGFGKPRQWLVRPLAEDREVDGSTTLYPCKGTMSAAIAKLPGAPKLNAKMYFNGYGEAQSRARATELGFEIVDLQKDPVVFDRPQIEDAMRAFDKYKADGSGAEIFDAFSTPSSYWVLSTSPSKSEPYPTKPIVGWILRQTALNGGWTPGSAAARLHDAGYVIVGQDGAPLEVPDQYRLLSGADRIRACARNYFIEPARDAGQTEVSVAARDVATLLGLTNSFPNICQALRERKFHEMVGSPKPVADGPDPSSTTVFTYRLSGTVSAASEQDEQLSEGSSPMSPTNLILYGPPGTGKTFETAAEAIKLCGEAVPEDRTAVMATYNRLRVEKRIEFVTFHQSMSYEDFIEGRQPTTEGTDGTSGTGFRLEPVKGIFRRIAERAEHGVSVPSGDTAITQEGRRVFKMSIGAAGDPKDNHLFEEAITQGHALLGWEDIDFSDDRFSDIEEILDACRREGRRDGEVTRQSGQVAQLNMFRNELSVGDVVVVTKGNGFFRAIGIVTGEYEYQPREGRVYTHRRSVNWTWVDRDGVPADWLVDGNFTMRSIYQLPLSRVKIPVLEQYLNGGEAAGTESLPHVLVIDEINRANISKVFGELITLIEPDKRLGTDNALTVRLPYSGDEFGVPANLHILGTMNTADRSIALLDTALRRRFEFREMMPRPDLLSKASALTGINLELLLTRINERIEYLFDREHQIGHAFFINCKDRAEVDQAMRNKVIPLLAEYFFEDWGKVALVLGDTDQDGGFLACTRLTAPPGLEDSGEEPILRWSVRDAFSYDRLAG